jgi:hypothetical protein
MDFWDVRRFVCDFKMWFNEFKEFYRFVVMCSLRFFTDLFAGYACRVCVFVMVCFCCFLRMFHDILRAFRFLRIFVADMQCSGNPKCENTNVAKLYLFAFVKISVRIHKCNSNIFMCISVFFHILNFRMFMMFVDFIYFACNGRPHCYWVYNTSASSTSDIISAISTSIATATRRRRLLDLVGY